MRKHPVTCSYVCILLPIHKQLIRSITSLNDLTSTYEWGCHLVIHFVIRCLIKPDILIVNKLAPGIVALICPSFWRSPYYVWLTIDGSYPPIHHFEVHLLVWHEHCLFCGFDETRHLCLLNFKYLISKFVFSSPSSNYSVYFLKFNHGVL